MTGEGIHNTTGTITDISDQTDVITVQLTPQGPEDTSPRYSDTVKVSYIDFDIFLLNLK